MTSILTSCSEDYRKVQIHNNEGVTVAKFPIKICSDKGQAAKDDVPSSYPNRKEERQVSALAIREGAFHKKQYKVENSYLYFLPFVLQLLQGKHQWSQYQ